MEANSRIESYTNAIESIIPASIMDEAKKIVEAHKPSGLPSGFEPINMAKVLLVEDKESWLNIYRSWAEEGNHEVTTATSPEKAVRLLQEKNLTLSLLTVCAMNGRKCTWLHKQKM